MTEEEKELLLNLLDKHELSLPTIISLLGIGATRTAMYAISNENEVLQQIMLDFNLDCMKFHAEHMEDYYNE